MMESRGREILISLPAPKREKIAQILLSLYPVLDLKTLIQIGILFFACDFINIMI